MLRPSSVAHDSLISSLPPMLANMPGGLLRFAQRSLVRRPPRRRTSPTMAGLLQRRRSANFRVQLPGMLTPVAEAKLSASFHVPSVPLTVPAIGRIDQCEDDGRCIACAGHPTQSLAIACAERTHEFRRTHRRPPSRLSLRSRWTKSGIAMMFSRLETAAELNWSLAVVGTTVLALLSCAFAASLALVLSIERRVSKDPGEALSGVSKAS